MNADAARSAYDEYVEHWLAHEPELRVARVLVASMREPRDECRRVLESVLLDAAIEVRDPALALAKLDWWRAELVAAAGGAARHPVTRRLLELDAGDAPGAAVLADAAAGVAALESPPDIDALCAPFREFARVGVAAGASEAAVDALGVATVILRLRRWPSFARASRARVPLATLARLGATRDALVRDRAATAAVVSALAHDLAARLPTRPVGDAATEARITCAAQVAAALRRAPEHAIDGGARARALPLLLSLWRAARRASRASAIVRAR